MKIAHIGGASCTDMIATEQAHMGHETEVFRRRHYMGFKGTVYRGPQDLLKLRRFDVIHLHAHRLLPGALETLIPGRKIVLHHHGCDVLGLGEPRGAEWAHHTFCNYDLATWCPKSEVIALPVNQSLDWGGEESDHVLHGETAPDKAGTQHVIDTCRELGVELVGLQPQRDMWMHHMKHARVVIGKVSRWHGMPGMTCNEAMAMGKPAMCWVSERCRKLMPSDMPVVSVTPETLRIELERLLRSRGLREELGSRGREYVRTHHNPQDIARRCVEVYRA